MASYNTIAIVIRRLNFGETDKILTLYSRDRGRFSAIAKGARKTVSRFSGATEVLTCTNFHLATGKSMEVVAQTEVQELFTPLRQDLIRLAHGLYLADLIDHAVEDHMPNPALFDLLIAGLYLAQEAPSPEIAARWFELQLLQDLGYQPNLNECHICHTTVDPDSQANPPTDTLAPPPTIGHPSPRIIPVRGGPTGEGEGLGLRAPEPARERPLRYALSASQGSVLCAEHERAGLIADHSALTPAALGLLQRLDAIPVETATLVTEEPVPDDVSLDQASLALRRYLRYRLERDLKSLAFLDSLRPNAT